MPTEQTALKQLINKLIEKQKDFPLIGKSVLTLAISHATDLLTLDKQQRIELAGKAFEAGDKYGSDQINVITPDGQIYPDKETYLNSLI